MSVLALMGGVGGAKMACGLYQILPDHQLTCLVNTADDFDYLGLRISPDLDSVMYALAGENNKQTGWGRRNETWQFMEALKRYGEEAWFALGDRDLATHILRTEALGRQLSLTAITAQLGASLGIRSHILPMTEDNVNTQLKTEIGELAFQDYFVKKQCEPIIREINFTGISEAKANPAVLKLLEKPLDCIVLCPSNPYLSLAPILALPGLVEALKAANAPVVAISPIVSGLAIKGPTAKIMRELGAKPSATGVAHYYEEQYPGLLSGFVVDEQDTSELAAIRQLSLDPIALPTVMNSAEKQKTLAKALLAHYGLGRRSH